ncbi:hypothetical protein K474DRAFT_1593860 [Panus rudis PR-1116 ss-1]|nr:hypothetical protein K474DRAFT_1593860 [Panus rudis PR-1116 ss-1]
MPQNARKPLRLVKKVTRKDSDNGIVTTLQRGLTREKSTVAPTHSDEEEGLIPGQWPRKPTKDDSPGTPRRTRTLTAGDAASSPSELGSEVKATATNGRTPRTRMTKKAMAAAEQARREAYAQQLFHELNESVFDSGLPKETRLIWSTRLLSTAGKAKWHRSKEGIHTTSIELATKVLDEDERIRNTLSHEMCHLACWVISNAPKENHGRIFKAWAAKVMRARPEIEVTTKHDYEINYPYEWECANCAKIYGRFSRSIRPDECVCGKCKTGKLIPLFTVRTRKPKTTADAKLTATNPRGIRV